MMFCDKANVNLLTAALLAYDITDVVLCPGSRNGVMAHNFTAHTSFNVFPVTDERSAAFVALGISLASGRPAAVCVTSGSALLNTLPAVAEASFRYGRLLVISADRPPQWIGQLDGQTLSQNGALLPYAATFQLPEPENGVEEKHCQDLIHNALLSLDGQGGRPAHINVPISEPLFTFTTPQLPEISLPSSPHQHCDAPIEETLLQLITQARLPILVVGQMDNGAGLAEIIERLDGEQQLLILPELVANLPQAWRTTLLEEILPNKAFHPDVVVHIGGNMVNKQLKQFLRNEDKGCRVIRIQPDEGEPDTFCHLYATVRSEVLPALKQLATNLPRNAQVEKLSGALRRQWAAKTPFCPTRFSDLGVMQKISRRIADEKGIVLHIANSSVIRNACHFFAEGRHAIYCNRGVNGIEGSLSTAAGFSLKTTDTVLCMTGDLSFFYDNNALWNTSLRGNLRIVLFNNGGGQIFRRLPGLEDTSARDKYIAGGHNFRAKGICEAYDVAYLSANSRQELENALPLLLQKESERPVLLEVFTDAADNEAVRNELKHCYHKS